MNAIAKLNCQEAARFCSKFAQQRWDCWPWHAGKDKGGYGKIRIQGKARMAHRVSWRHFRGRIPRRKMVLHSCDNRGCVNPSHLYLGNQIRNMRDMVKRGRSLHRYGETAPRSKLTNIIVLEIFAALEAGANASAIARTYGVRGQTISAIRSGQNWSHITGRRVTA